MPTVKQIIEHSNTGLGRLFDLSIQTLIIASLITFSVETLPDLPAQVRAWLHGFEMFTVIVFTVEYILRVIAAPNKVGFIFSFFGIVDLLAILPFYLATGIDLRSVRSVRIFRLIRLLKMARYNSALRRFYRAMILVREEFILFLLMAAVLLFLASTGIYYFEHAAQPDVFASVFHSMWWAVATFTTVGYGDVYPITVGGKIFTSLILVVGLGIVAVPTGLVASALTKVREIDERRN